MPTFRTSCRWYLEKGRRHLCYRETFNDPTKDFRELRLGCDCDVEKEFQPIEGKDRTYADPGETVPIPVVEIDDEE